MTLRRFAGYGILVALCAGYIATFAAKDGLLPALLIVSGVVVVLALLFLALYLILD